MKKLNRRGSRGYAVEWMKVKGLSGLKEHPKGTYEARELIRTFL